MERQALFARRCARLLFADAAFGRGGRRAGLFVFWRDCGRHHRVRRHVLGAQRPPRAAGARGRAARGRVREPPRRGAPQGHYGRPSAPRAKARRAGRRHRGARARGARRPFGGAVFAGAAHARAHRLPDRARGCRRPARRPACPRVRRAHPRALCRDAPALRGGGGTGRARKAPFAKSPRAARAAECPARGARTFGRGRIPARKGRVRRGCRPRAHRAPALPRRRHVRPPAGTGATACSTGCLRVA